MIDFYRLIPFAHGTFAGMLFVFFLYFNFKNIMLDGVSRVGLVWNNMRWYSGASAVFHSYNYHKSNFSANTMFGNVYIYAGYNFGLKKQYRKKR